MKLSVSLSLLAVVGSAVAFAPSPKTLLSQSPTALESQSSRHDFLQQSAAILFSVGTVSLARPAPASAAKYGGFGAGSPEVLNPAEAEIDMNVLKSDAVQNALKKVQGYQSAVRGMQATLESNAQADLKKTIFKELEFSSLRSTLNTVNSAFEEDTQRGTDRLIRVIMQDITELETANQQKEGIPRSARRLEIMNGKLTKLDQAFSDYLEFTK